MSQKRIHTTDAEQLACHILDLDYDQIDGDEDIIEEWLEKQFGCDLEQFSNIVERLLPLIDAGRSELTRKAYKGFADIKNGIWLVKMEIPVT